jgi:hypothetical protein
LMSVVGLFNLTGFCCSSPVNYLVGCNGKGCLPARPDEENR